MSFIFFIGMPAAGKTWWGRKVADAYHLPFADLDELIEKKENKTVAQLFETAGESYFRDKESEVLSALIENDETLSVVACGGGTPLRETNLALMQKRGCVVYLQAEIDTLIKNLRAGVARRPLLLQHGNLRDYLQELFEKRKKVYERADYILQVETISLANFEEIIHSCTDRH